MSTLEIMLVALLAAAVLFAWVQRTRLKVSERRHAVEIEAKRNRRKEELKAQDARTNALFDRMVEGIIVVDPAGRIRLANRAAGAFFKFAPPAAGSTVLEATKHHEVAALIRRLDSEPEVLCHELPLQGIASTRYLEVNALALRMPDGSHDGALLVFHDVTRLRELEGVRQEFVANVSHELRTPLSLIKSAAETLIDGGKDDPAVAARFLEIIDRQANRLTLLIEDLLLLARLDSHRIELRLQPVSLRAAAQEVLEDAAHIARERKVVLENTVPEELRAQADPDRLRQVLTNLLDNAIKYGRAGGRVTVGGRPLDAGRIEMSVRDDGPGIPPAAQSRIFERFYRADKARSRELGGTGLGLSIVKNVVQAHGGEVWVASEPGKGTEFFLTLPASPPQRGGGGA